MNEKIKQHLINYHEKMGYNFNCDDLLIETIGDASVIYREEKSQHRWWNVYFYVVEIDGMLIGYDWAEANRDESVEELGWDFDLDSICEVVKKEKIIYVYEKK